MDMSIYGQGPSTDLKAADFKGKNLKVVISEVGTRTYPAKDGQREQTKTTLNFEGKEKTLVLNTTNGNSIAEALGWETQGWIGKQIELFPTTTEFAGKMVDCIRVRIPVAAPVPAASVAAAVGGGGEVPF